MRILMVNDEAGELGGAEVVISQLTHSLRAKGHVVKLLSGRVGASQQYHGDYEFRSFANNSRLRYILYIYNPFSRSALKRAIHEFRPDVVHLHNVSKASPSMLFGLKRVPTVMTAHDLECVDPTIFSEIKSLHPYKKNYENYFIFSKGVRYYLQKFRYYLIKLGQRNINVIVAISNAMATVLREGGIQQPIVVVYNGKSSASKKKTIYRDKPSNILFVGRLVPEKGAEVLIRALKKVVKSLPESKLTIVGDGPSSNTLRAQVQRAGLNGSVKFAGKVPQSEINEYYDNTDLVVVPSVWYEPLGIVAIEAMQHGKPVIVSNAGGLKEMVDDRVNGFVVRRNDADQLSEKILKLLSDSQLIRTMGQRSLRRGKQFTVENFVGQMVGVYDKAIQRKSYPMRKANQS